MFYLQSDYKVLTKNNPVGFAGLVNPTYEDKADNYLPVTYSLENYTRTRTYKPGVDYDPAGITYYYRQDTTVKRLNSKTGKYKNTKVKDGSQVLAGDIVSAGTQLVMEVPFIGNYGGTCRIRYTVLKNAIDISKATIKVKNSYVFSAETKNLTPEDFEVTLNGKVVPADCYSVITNGRSIYDAGENKVTLYGNSEKGYTGYPQVTVKVSPKKVN